MSERKLKVLAIVPTAFCFGLQQITLELFKFSHDKLDAHFLVTRWNDGEFIRRLNALGFDFSMSWLGMFSRRMDWQNLKMSFHAAIRLPVLYFDFLRLIRSKKPDLIYFANHHELILLLPIVWIVRVPVFCHMHDPSPSSPFHRFTFYWYNKVVTRYIAISNSVSIRLVLLGGEPSRITVIHNGVAVPEDRYDRNELRRKWGMKHDDFVMGIAGQMTETKGHMDLLRAFLEVHDVRPEAKLVIAGRRLEPMYSKIVEYVTEHQLSGHVILSDWLADLNAFYQVLDLYVLPSRHDEGYGLVVAEAMANGTPALVTNSGGVIEIVENGIDGWIIPKGDHKIMVDVLLQIIDNRDLYNRVKSLTIKKIKEKFDIKSVAQRFVNCMSRGSIMDT